MYGFVCANHTPGYLDHGPFRAVVPLLLVVAMISATEQSAAQQGAAVENEIEEIVVTGSRLIRTDLSAPSPIVTIDSDTLRYSGNFTLEQTLNQYPQLQVDVTSQTNARGGAGVLSANLRALGPTRTLVLVNGRRFAPANTDGLVDLATIPDPLVKQVDIITGGASAVYGSDAIAGAVNFTLIDDFEGADIGVSYGETSEGDGSTVKADLVLGTNFADDRGNVVVHGSFTDGDPVFFADRDFSAVTVNPNSSGQLVPSGSGNIPGTRIGLSASDLASLNGVDLTPPAQCSAITGIRFGNSGEPLPFCDPEDRFNFAPLNFLLRPRNRSQISALADYEFADDISIYSEFFYIDNSQGFQQAPAAFSPVTLGAAPGTLIVPNLATNPLLSQDTIDFFTANAALFDANGDGDYEIVGSTRRADELGARKFDYDRNTRAYTVGLKGEFGSNSPWRWDTYYQSHDTSQLFVSQNVTSTRSLNAGLDVVIDPNSGEAVCSSTLFRNCVPINIFGIGSITEEMGQFLTPVRFQSTTLERQVFSASIAGDILEMPAGPLSSAFGFEWREDKFDFVPDDVTQNDGSREVPPNSGEFDVSEVFAELRAPLLSDLPGVRQLAVEGAVRFSDYSTIGNATTWRAGADWTIIDGLRVRGFFNRAIRAPSLIDLFATQTAGFTNGQDPCDIDNSPTSAQQDLCVQQGIDPAEISTFQQINIGLTTVGGGNPDLTEEESDTITFGFVYQPSFAEGLNITADYYTIEVTGAIASVTAQFVLDECFRTVDSNGDFCQRISRLSDGQLFEVESTIANVAEIKVRGVDLQVDYVFDLPSDAVLDLNWFAGWQFERSITAIPGAPPLDCAGKFGNSCSGTGVPVVLDFKTTIDATYINGPFLTTLRARVLGDLDIREGQTEFINSVGSQTYVDLSAAFEVTDQIELYGGINNLGDKSPPVMGFRLGGPPNTNTGVYDLIGRRYFIGARAVF